LNGQILYQNLLLFKGHSHFLKLSLEVIYIIQDVISYFWGFFLADQQFI